MTRTVTRAGQPLPEGQDYDVTVIGAGVVGTAIARELARHRVRTALVEASDDIGNGTSKANTAILHTGFDAVPGSLEARLVREGQRGLAVYAAETGIPVERVGALLVAWDQEQLDSLPGLLTKAESNGYHAARLLDAKPARRDRTAPGAGRARCAGDSRRVRHLPVDHPARLRHPGGPGKRPPAPGLPRHGHRDRHRAR